MTNPLPHTSSQPSKQAETREKLIQAALNAFAEQGVQAVTLASIRQAAGQANRSVVHYHFKDRDELVKAVVQRVSDGLGAYMKEAQQKFEMDAFSKPDKLPALVKLIFQPFWQYFIQHKEGRVGIQFLSRMTWQTGELGEALLRDFFKPYFAHFALSLASTLPHLTPADIQLRIYLGVNTAIHGLADTGIIMRDPDMAALLTREDAMERAYSILIGYLSGGIGADLG